VITTSDPCNTATDTATPSSSISGSTREARPAKARITLIDYDESRFQEREILDIEEVLPFKDSPTVTWINIDGLNDAAVMEKIAQHFGIHHLVMEDIVTTNQRPKLEDLGDYTYIVLRMMTCNGNGELVTEQVSLILGPNYVISFQERVGDVFDQIRDRIRTGKGRVRRMGADYLAYCLIDAIVDNYFAVLEKLGERVEAVEDELISNPTPQTLVVIRDSKRDLLLVRKTVWPLREVVDRLERGESRLVKKSTAIYLRDVYDHTIQIIDTVETLRDMVSGMLEIYLSSISNRLNEVMKVLTIIATIFIPLTFIVGIYGMNFRYMPEIESKWGYPAVIVTMAIVAGVMVLYFRMKRWL